MSIKLLQEKYPKATIKKGLFQPYDYQVTLNNKVYHIKMLRLRANNILSFNSKYVWEIRYGKGQGITFKTTHSKRLDIKEFNRLQNKIIVLKNAPLKILKYINESEVIDITSEESVYDIPIYRGFEGIILE